ncbi:MAG: hypothetical protein ABH869_06600 [Candidatus Omnitrophota bacterium]
MNHRHRTGELAIKTAIDLFLHFIFTFLLAVFFKNFTGSWVWPFLAVAGGIFIDIDHFIDYHLYYGFKFHIGDFFKRGYLASGKCYIVFHSWELVFVLWLLAVPVISITPLVLGMTIHLLIDQFYSRGPKTLSLFFFYRWYHHFSADAV